VNYFLLIGWDRPVPGRESNAHERFAAFNAYLATQLATQKVKTFETCLLRPHGGNLNGFFMVRGDKNQLDDLRETDQWKDWEAWGNHTMLGFRVVDGLLGDNVADMMARYKKLA
jgi:hypothetical protein